MEYRQLRVETAPHALTEARRAFLDDFLQEFGDGLFYEANGDQCFNLFVSTIDFRRLAEKTAGLDESSPNQDKAIAEALCSELYKVRSYGLRAGKRVYAGYNNERKVKGRKTKAARRKPSRTASGLSDRELPTEFENRIACGDSLDVLKRLPDNCVDLMLTSPPYNFGLDYEASEDADRWQDYFDKLFAILDETIRVLKHGGRLVINIQPLFSDYIPTHHVISHGLLERGMLWKGEILWEKNNYNCKYTAWGSWKSPSSPYLKYSWEFLEIFCKGTRKHVGETSDIDITADEFKQWVYGKWSIAPERRMQDYGHPAMYPETLAMRVLKLFSYQGDLILDVFNGVGTTTAVAKKLGRRYLGIDVSPEYCRIAEDRVRNVLV